jgi:Tfp pilus assembly protein FimT
MRRTSRSGITYVELLIVMVIIGSLSVLTYSSFRTINATKSVDGDALRVTAELNQARSLTLASKYAKQYGVHFAPTTVTLFEGSSFVVGSATNTAITMSPLISITSISLTGGGSDVIFGRLTGTTTQNGTVVLTSAATGNATRTITIYPTGTTEIR